MKIAFSKKTYNCAIKKSGEARQFDGAHFMRKLERCFFKIDELEF